MNHDAKIGAVILGCVIAWIVFFGGYVYCVMLASSIADESDHVDEPDPSEPAATEVAA